MIVSVIQASSSDDFDVGRSNERCVNVLLLQSDGRSPFVDLGRHEVGEGVGEPATRSTHNDSVPGLVSSVIDQL